MARFLMIIVMIITAGVLLTMERDASAATIFGTIYQNNQPLLNKNLNFDCAKVAMPSKTDDRGNYRLSANHLGRCTLSIGAVSAVVIFYQDPTRYDFDFDGSQLRRR